MALGLPVLDKSSPETSPPITKPILIKADPNRIGCFYWFREFKDERSIVDT